ncbi:hypothetical protein PPERSA_10958 [Pseudocohnilembus persalinus]|uniref:PI3K/PI4K catalytic domain-containing protein n=1 Tax=Pseudocohnilembus persalinus TaxID=266149 RepID=A0A0V0QCI9_PSEPJ|nr:hypothetical protein PPERSA_10958 [Pseudocohnilembus persalinus]|eukprot:KRW99839.1 hypothetical protein PPERSA_10958 [Pseudocohnilembus persalinus]
MTQNNATLDSFGVTNKMYIQMYESKAYDEIGDIRPYNIFGQKLYNKRFQQLGKPSDLNILNEQLIEINSGFQFNIKPELTDDGTSGAYFLCNKNRKKIAVFKPQDEEAYAPNNPRKLVGEMGQLGIRNGIYSGESAVREVAAYLLDFYSQGRHGVPITTFVEFFHPYFSDKSDQIQCNCKSQQIGLNQHKQSCPKKKFAKYGSLQLFQKHQAVVGDYGSSLFPVDEIHKIAILDIRILNCDRNDENILIEKIDKSQKKYKIDKLIPIDHGLSLPDTLEINDEEIVWMGWDEVKKPLSQENKEFILNMNIDDQVKLLRSNLKIREKSLRLFKEQFGEPDNSDDDDDDDDFSDKLPSKLEKVLELAENFYQSNNIPQNDFKKVISDVNHNNNYEIKPMKLKTLQTDSEDEESTTETNPNLPLKNHLKIPLNNKISEDPEKENLEDDSSQNNDKENNEIKQIELSQNNLNSQKKEKSDKQKSQDKKTIRVQRSKSQPNMPKNKPQTKEKKSDHSSPKNEQNKENSDNLQKSLQQNNNINKNQSLQQQKQSDENQSQNNNQNGQNSSQNNQQNNENNNNHTGQKRTTLYNRGTKNFNTQALQMKKNDEDEFRDEKYYECFEYALNILIFKEQTPSITKEKSSPRKRFMSEQIEI